MHINLIDDLYFYTILFQYKKSLFKTLKYTKRSKSRYLFLINIYSNLIDTKQK